MSDSRSWSNGWQDTIDKVLEETTGITAELFLQIMATHFVHCSHHTNTSQKVLIVNCSEPRVTGDNLLFPLFDEGQWGRLFDLLQQAVHKAGWLSKGVVPLICCGGGVNKIVGNWNRNMYHKAGHQKLPPFMPCDDKTQRRTWHSVGTILVCSYEMNSKFPGTTTCPRRGWTGLLTDFKKEMQQTELQSRHRMQIKVSVKSLLLKHQGNSKCGYETVSTRPGKKEDLTKRLSPSSLRPVFFK